MPSNDDIITGVLAREGGSTYTNDPNDPGGATKYGITLSTLSEFRGTGFTVTSDDVKNLTEEEARLIYLNMYIVKPGFYQINDWNLRDLVVDCAVNNGRDRTTRWLQIAVGTIPDGVFGPVTTKAVNERDAKTTYYKLLSIRVRAYSDLARANHSLLIFLPGWINRAAEFIGRSLA